ncbi:MAG: hypothetical protein LGB62_05830 [Sulfurovum sp.]|nr:hypothetical protein [Sulfurovum sp.]MCB4780708.1 hypothetical protein [Sulfurovum sp.]MCB4783720.1 hypothetical protein [Sulfurovum sp.]
MNNLILILIFLMTLILFFWGIWKALRTQKVIYMAAMIPFFGLMVAMFFL